MSDASDYVCMAVIVIPALWGLWALLRASVRHDQAKAQRRYNQREWDLAYRPWAVFEQDEAARKTADRQAYLRGFNSGSIYKR